MLSAPDKALLVKLFYMNEESATIALRNWKKLEDRARAGRPCLKEERAPCIAVEMEAIASEAASETSSAGEAARRLGY
ncbi:hypothetical protein TNCV_1850001 [Trichonephila clavipes]|nr:hypothetical protein TNCV_1850001 [Trichonephila clavipes]